MRYIIMCGGKYNDKRPKHLMDINGEPIVGRTYRLLIENGIDPKDIYITIGEWSFYWYAVSYLKVTTNVIVMGTNKFGEGGRWLDGFETILDEPTTYLYGDVIFSPEAIKTIVETETDSIEFFASAPPFSPRYTKRWAEPFAFKVVDMEYFAFCIQKTKNLADEGRFNREPISWELWQVIKRTRLNEIDYTNYTAINDYSCDVDCEDDLEKIRGQM